MGSTLGFFPRNEERLVHYSTKSSEDNERDGGDDLGGGSQDKRDGDEGDEGEDGRSSDGTRERYLTINSIRREAWNRIYAIIGIVKIQPTQWRKITLRELLICYDSYLLSTWDHTAFVLSGIHNLTITVINMVSKAKVRAKSMSHFHPYRKVQRTGLKITHDNFSKLKMICRGYGRRK